MKSEPDVFSIEDLRSAKGKRTCWDGVRNYQARNFMRDEMKKGDLVLFYHSRVQPIGVAGVAEVVKESYPDHTQFDAKDSHFDPKSKPEDPRWFMVDIKHKKSFDDIISLQDLRQTKGLEKMPLLQRGQRLSVQPVAKKEFDIVTKLGN